MVLFYYNFLFLPASLRANSSFYFLNYFHHFRLCLNSPRIRSSQSWRINFVVWNQWSNWRRLRKTSSINRHILMKRTIKFATRNIVSHFRERRSQETVCFKNQWAIHRFWRWLERFHFIHDLNLNLSSQTSL